MKETKIQVGPKPGDDGSYLVVDNPEIVANSKCPISIDIVHVSPDSMESIEISLDEAKDLMAALAHFILTIEKQNNV